MDTAPSLPPSAPAATVRDIAKKTGVNPATVSRALRNHPNVAPATRTRILAEAQKAGYRSNALVNALMAQVRQRHRLKPTGEVVAYLTSSRTEDAWRELPSHMQQFEGAREQARQFGFDLQPMWLGSQCDRSAQAARMLRARGIRGSLLAPVPLDHRSMQIDWSEHAVVSIGYSFRQVALHRAVHDCVSLAFACYSQLRKMGHRRIGLAINTDGSNRVRHLWLAGFLMAQRVHGDDRTEPLLLADYSHKDPAPFRCWLDGQAPDAVIGIWPDVQLDWIRDCGARVPEDVSYASLDPGNRTGQLAGMLQDNHGVGTAAIDLLASQLFRNEIGIPKTPTVTMIEGIWVDGPTVARRKQAKH
ncbi:transcriptional regulator [Opitutaceae bacterium TAV1]|nr:transcriptional regulator [Opitutaceae bacterium TAV1]